MEPKKMSPEELERNLLLLYGYAPGPIRAIRAHIAALEAERDELAKTVAARGAYERAEMDWRKKVQSERDAARERVQALEAAGQTLSKECERFRTGWEDAERHLAAIRHAAFVNEGADNMEKAEALDKVHSLLGGVVGEDATGAAPLHCEHCRERPATCVGRYEGHGAEARACDECCGHGNEDGHCRPIGSTPASPEPSTAEAVATVDLALEDMTGHDDADRRRMAREAKRALSLLERRMGAMGRVLRKVVGDTREVWDEWEDGEGNNLGAEIAAALADAPPVFTLEEVREAMLSATSRSHPGIAEAVKRDILAALRKG